MRLRETSLGMMLWSGSPAGPMAILAALALALLFGPTAQAAPPVLQRGYDASVTGADLTETTLNTSNVNTNTFGLVFMLPLDDVVYAQPLYVPAVAIPNQGVHNVLYVATMSDTLYAFDADTGAALWSTNFASLVGASPVQIANFVFAGPGSTNIVGNLGILSTPVIDSATNIMYLVACTLESNTLVYRLHAVDITTGTEPYGPGVLISGSYATTIFNPIYLTQRLSLALSGGQVVFGFAAQESEATLESQFPGSYTGWVMAYDELTLQQSGIFATVTTGQGGGGVWQSGRPPAVDPSGFIYIFTGNAYTNGYDGVSNFGESVLKLDPAQGLRLLDWFTPSNWAGLDSNDADLGSSGPLLIPGTQLLAGGGKAGVFYVLDTASLGKFSATDQVVQEEAICPALSPLRGGPVYWQRSIANGGPLLYNWCKKDVVKAYAFSGTTFAASPSAQGTLSSQSGPGGILTLSANGEQHGTGVLWATIATATGNPVPGELHALNAENVSQELWNSTMNAARDGFGNFAKFVPPLVANGRVYLATGSNQVAVYGLFLSSYTRSPTSLPFGNVTVTVASAPLPITVTNTGTVALPITSIAFSNTTPHAFSQTNNCGTSIALRGTCTISAVFTPAATGLKTGMLSITAGGGAGTQTVALTGTGVVAPYTRSPTSLAFGNVTVTLASAPLPITVTNTGTVALPITNITLANNSPHPFSQTNNCGTSIAVGGTCTISVVFNPTAVGATTGKLSINAGGGAGAQTVALTGTGVAAPYTRSPTSLAFGNVPVTLASAPLPITVTNTGTVALAITSITLSNTGLHPYSQTNNCGTSVAVGGTCTISVVFAPTAAGSKTGVLSINAGGGAGTQTVTLAGTGVAAPYTLSPTSLAFGNVPVTVASAPLPITVTNTGTVALAITSITLSNTGLHPYSQTNNCGTSVAVGGTCTISVVFNPTVTGLKKGLLTINAGGGAGTQTAALTGTGV